MERTPRSASSNRSHKVRTNLHQRYKPTCRMVRSPWTISAVAERICALLARDRGAEGERRGRPAASEVVRVVSALRNAVSELENCVRRLAQVPKDCLHPLVAREDRNSNLSSSSGKR